MNIFAPPASLLAKVGSILAHVDEGLSDDGHHFDWAAARALMQNEEVQDWMSGMRKAALLPVRRK